MQTLSTSSNPNFIGKVDFADDADHMTVAPSGDTVLSDSTIEPPIETFAERKGYPYLAKALDVQELYGKTGQEQDMQFIDNYIINSINSQQYKSDTSSYMTILNQLKTEANISEQHDYTEQIRRLATMVIYRSKEKELKRISKIINGTTD